MQFLNYDTYILKAFSNKIKYWVEIKSLTGEQLSTSPNCAWK